MRRLAVAVCALLLAAAPVSASDADDHAVAVTEEQERSALLVPHLEAWTLPGVTPETLTEVEALTSSTLEWLDTLHPAPCWRPWWAAMRTSWEMLAAAVRTQRAGAEPVVVRTVFISLGQVRGLVGLLGRDACPAVP